MDDFFKIFEFSCGYKSGFSIHNISFAIGKGSFTGIVGPNGSGKTTLFRGITGELKKKSGFGETSCIFNFRKDTKRTEKVVIFAVLFGFVTFIDVTNEKGIR